MEHTNKKVIAAFDFDGTLTTRDTFFDILLFYFGSVDVCIRIVRKLHIFLSTSIENRKEVIFSFFFKEMTNVNFNELCMRYARNVLPARIRKDALNMAYWHQMQGHKVIIVSASQESWIRPWSESQGIFHDVIATVPEISNGLLTGRFMTKNCVLEEKVARFLERFPNREEYILYAYGDDRRDIPLLKFADYSFYRCF